MDIHDGNGLRTVTVVVSIDVVVIVLVVVVTELLDDTILGAIDDVVEVAVVEVEVGLGSQSGLGLGIDGAVHFLNNFKFFCNPANFPKS